MRTGWITRAASWRRSPPSRSSGCWGRATSAGATTTGARRCRPSTRACSTGRSPGASTTAATPTAPTSSTSSAGRRPGGGRTGGGAIPRGPGPDRRSSRGAAGSPAVMARTVSLSRARISRHRHGMASRNSKRPHAHEGWEIDRAASVEVARGDVIVVAALADAAKALPFAPALARPLDVARSARGEEVTSFGRKPAVLLAGADARGLMYALLDAAEPRGAPREIRRDLARRHPRDRRAARGPRSRAFGLHDEPRATGRAASTTSATGRATSTRSPRAASTAS